MSGPVVTVLHEGLTFDIDPADWEDRRWLSRAGESERARWLDAFERGDLYVEGVRLGENQARRQRSAITGKFRDPPPVWDATIEGPTRALIPGLQTYDSFPAFIAPKWWGKTSLITQLGAALVIPGFRFLGVFGPVQVSRDDEERDVVLINPETRPAAFHEDLLAAGLLYDNSHSERALPYYYHPDSPRVLIVEHLRKMSGGPTALDVTDPVKWEWWENRLIERVNGAPLYLVADSITSIVGNQTARARDFASAFRQLMEAVGVAAGLGILHSPMNPNVHTAMEGLESMAEWDGAWFGSASEFPPRSSSKRAFWTMPRMGDPEVLEHTIVLNDNRMQRAIPRTAREPVDQAPSSPVDHGQLEQVVIDKLCQAGKAGLTALELTGASREGEDLRKARDRLASRDPAPIFSIRDGRFTRWFLTEFR